MIKYNLYYRKPFVDSREIRKWTDWKFICAYDTLESIISSANTFKSINPNYQYRIKPEGL